jgi:hypothetical protein
MSDLGVQDFVTRQHKAIHGQQQFKTRSGQNSILALLRRWEFSLQENLLRADGSPITRKYHARKKY